MNSLKKYYEIDDERKIATCIISEECRAQLTFSTRVIAGVKRGYGVSSLWNHKKYHESGRFERDLLRKAGKSKPAHCPFCILKFCDMPQHLKKSGVKNRKFF